MERYFASVYGYGSKGFESFEIILAPVKGGGFEVVNFDRASKLDHIVFARLDVKWFWMKPLPPENIKIDLEKALCQAMVSFKIENKKDFNSKKKKEMVEKETQKILVKKLGKKSDAQIKLNILH